MKKFFIVCCLHFFFIACQSKIEKEYFENGSIKKEFVLKNGKYEGKLKKYFDTGDLKEVHTYLDGNRIDSSLYFKEGGILNYIEYHQGDTTIFNYRKYYYPNNSIQSEGMYNKLGLPVGKWSYYDEDDGYLKEVKEIKNINGKPHLNQRWYFDKNGDTIFDNSTFLSLHFLADTIMLDEAVKVYAELKYPLFKDKSSSIMAIVPRDNSEDFNEDFSNGNIVKRDTTFNLNIEKEYRLEAGLPDRDYSREVIFGRYYKSPGLKKFRGIIVEYFKTDTITKDSLNFFEHKIYFEKDIYVKDTL